MGDIKITGLLEKFKKGGNRLILLDYDGTLVDHEVIPQEAILSDDLVDILMKLIDKPQTWVLIVSGRDHADIDKLVDHLPINIIAEHGAMMKTGGVWRDQATKEATWKGEVITIFNQFNAACPGSYTEEKKFSLTWHYRNSDSREGYACSRELISKLGNFIPSGSLKILDGNKVVEIMAPDIGKGIAVKELLEKGEYDFILSIGDDTTDEEIFELLLQNENAFTIKVGNGKTFAKERLTSVNDVVMFLKHLAE